MGGIIMLEYNKLYTVEDVANRTGLTDRTIRNYLRDGKLKGKKIGGQWRFTVDDIEALFHTPGDNVGGRDAAFNEPCTKVNPDVYAVVEYECDPETADDLSERLRAEAAAGSFMGNIECSYNNNAARAKFVLRGSADFVAAMLKPVRKSARKG